MPITVQGIRVKCMSVTRDEEEGTHVIKATYDLMSSTGSVLARSQSLSSKESYSETVFMPSAATVKLFGDAAAAYKKDVEAFLGLE